MKVEKIKFMSRTKRFCAEPVPGNLGIRFMEYNERGEEECIAMIIDHGKEFLLTSKNRDGMLIRPFMPTTQLLLRDGITKAPLDGEEQIEVHTHYNKKMIVRTLSKEHKGSGVVVAYEKNGTLWSVALCGAPTENLIISLAM